MTNSRSAAPMMKAIKEAFEGAKYRGSESADVFLEALHEAGYEIVTVAHENAVPVRSVAEAYGITCSLPATAKVMGGVF